MTTVAVVLAVLWLLTAFVLRIAIQVRATGDSGVRVHGSVLSRAGMARVLFTLATVVVGVAPMLVGAGAFDRLSRPDGPFVAVAGLVLAGGGIVATFVAQLAMGRSWRIGLDPGERTELVTAGAFAVVRNPIFTTMGATSLGLWLLVPTAAGLAGLLVLLVALELQVRGVEEPYLRAVHGSHYRAYEAEVGRFLPALGRRPVT